MTDVRSTHRFFSSPTLALAALAAVVVTAAAPGAVPAAADERGPVRIVERYVDQVLDGGRHDLLPELVSPDVVDGFRKALELRRALFPDLHYRVEEIVAEGNRVVVRCTVTGHHVGDEPEKLPDGEVIPASGNYLETEEVLFYTVEGGRIAHGKVVSDQLDVAKALGFTVVPPEGFQPGSKD